MRQASIGTLEIHTSPFFAGRQILLGAGTKTTPSILRLATIQCIESKQDLAGLAPKDCFIAAKPVERIAWQIGQT